MKVIAVASQKGGVGKSTTASCLADGLRLKGKKVLLIDLDAQRNLSIIYGAVNPKISILKVLSGEATVTEAIEKHGDSCIIASEKGLYLADKQINRPTALRDSLGKLHGEFDYVVLDCPPALSILTVNALVSSDYVVIPSQADLFSLQGIYELADTIDAVRQKANKDLKVLGILLTRYNKRAVLNKDVATMLQDQAEKMGTKLFNATIRDSVTVREAQISKQDLYSYSPKAKVTEDYKAFVNEFLKGVENNGK